MTDYTTTLADRRLWTAIELNLIRWLMQHDAINHDINALRAVHIRLVNAPPLDVLTGPILELHDRVVAELVALMADTTGLPADHFYRPLSEAPDDPSELTP